MEYNHNYQKGEKDGRPVGMTTTSLHVAHPQNVYMTAQPVPQFSNVIMQPAGTAVGRTIPIIQHPQTVLPISQAIHPIPAFTEGSPTAPSAQMCQQDTATNFQPNYNPVTSPPMVDPPSYYTGPQPPPTAFPPSYGSVYGNYPGPPPPPTSFPPSSRSVYEDLPPPCANLN